MRRFVCLLSLGASLFLVGACQGPQPQSDYRPTATIKDIMDSIVDPSADALWHSVATVSSATGIEDRQPRTAEEWANVRRDAIRLVEASNLLVLEGRHVARPGEKAENSGVELEPQKIEKLINDDRHAFIELAHGLSSLEYGDEEYLFLTSTISRTTCVAVWRARQRNSSRAVTGLARPTAMSVGRRRVASCST